MSNRQGNNPKRRIAAVDRLDPAGREALVGQLVYVGRALHKRRPGDYGFHPPANPRPSKSLCDGIRPILKGEAKRIFREGILKGMFSDFVDGELPKYVWCVDSEGEVYEAKTGLGGYHGYGLEYEDVTRDGVLREWKQRR